MQNIALVIVLLLMGLVVQTGKIVPDTTRGEFWLLSLGFILLGAFLAGQTAKKWSLPGITGYLLLGVLVGPEVLGLVTSEALEELSIINGLAVALIAMSAGGELKFSWLKNRVGQVATITFVEAIFAMLAVTSVAYFMRGYLPDELTETNSILWASLVLMAVIGVANSPTVAIAIINESRSQGPVSRIILVVTVFKDIAIILLFTLALEVARSFVTSGGFNAMEFAQGSFFKIFGSGLFGIMLAVPLAYYCRNIGREMPAVVIGVCFFIALVGRYFGLEPLLAALALGCYIENFSSDAGPKLIRGIERSSLPVYCLFFGLAGASLQLSQLLDAIVLIATLVLARGVGIYVGTNLGAKMAGIEPDVRRWLWTGLVSQAGVSLAMASIVADTFPAWGQGLMTLIIAMVAAHEMFGPIVFHWALKKSGEAGRATAGSGEHPSMDLDSDSAPATT